MAIKFEKVRPGMRLLDIHKQRMGNTTMSRIACWDVFIVSVDRKHYRASVRWNGNPARDWSRRKIERLYTKIPERYRKDLSSYVREPDNSKVENLLDAELLDSTWALYANTANLATVRRRAARDLLTHLDAGGDFPPALGDAEVLAALRAFVPARKSAPPEGK